MLRTQNRRRERMHEALAVASVVLLVAACEVKKAPKESLRQHHSKRKRRPSRGALRR